MGSADFIGRTNFRFLVFLPTIPFVCFLVTPDWTPSIGYSAATIMGLSFFWAVLGKIRTVGGVPTKHTQKFIIAQADLFAIFLLGLVWRVWGEPLWLGFLLLGVIALCIFLGHKYRMKIMDVYSNPNRGRNSRIIGTVYTLITLGPLLFGGGSYLTIKTVFHSLEGEVGTLWTFRIIYTSFIPLALFMFVFFHATWSRQEKLKEQRTFSE